MNREERRRAAKTSPATGRAAERWHTRTLLERAIGPRDLSEGELADLRRRVIALKRDLTAVDPTKTDPALCSLWELIRRFESDNWRTDARVIEG